MFWVDPIAKPTMGCCMHVRIWCGAGLFSLVIGAAMLPASGDGLPGDPAAGADLATVRAEVDCATCKAAPPCQANLLASEQCTSTGSGCTKSGAGCGTCSAAGGTNCGSSSTTSNCNEGTVTCCNVTGSCANTGLGCACGPSAGVAAGTTFTCTPAGTCAPPPPSPPPPPGS